MSRARTLLATCALFAASTLGATVPAAAQDEGAVRLQLLEQTPFATPDVPLSIRIAAFDETDTTYRELQLSVAVYAAVGSRSEYAQTLEVGPVSPVDAETWRLRGPLPAGGARSFPAVELPMAELGINALHPVTVELRADGGFTPLAVLRTSVVVIAEEPKVPLNVAVAFVLDEELRLAPDGTHLDTGLEEAIAPAGRLDTIVTALEEVEVPVTLPVSPLVLLELQRMSDGYRVGVGEDAEDVPPEDPRTQRAGAMLERISAIAHRPDTEVVAMPYASPSIPALAAAGLDADLREQVERGRQTVADVLGVEPSPTVFRPPASAITTESLDNIEPLLGTGAALLLDGEVLEPPAGLTLSPPAVASVETANGTELPALAPDPLVEARLAGALDDPLLSAMRAIGELSALYFELPSEDRGAVVVFGEDDEPSPELLLPLLTALTKREGITWLEGVKSTRVLFADTGESDPEIEPRDLADIPRAILSSRYLAELDRTRGMIAALDSLEPPDELVDRMRTQVLRSEARALVHHQDLALEYLRATRAEIETEFGKIRPPEERTVTLTSREGTIPVTIQHDADYPVKVRLEMLSSRLEFPDGTVREVTLDRPLEQFTFPVEAQTTGRFPVRVVVETPSGAPIADTALVVRSTSYNRIALFVTIGAALFLALWWGRRLLPRRRRG